MEGDILEVSVSEPSSQSLVLFISLLSDVMMMMMMMRLLQQRPQSDGVMCLPLSSDKASDLRYVENFQLDTGNQKIRILVIGPVGAGKSSFINSVHSVLLGRMYALAGVENVCGQTFTDRVRLTRSCCHGEPFSSKPSQPSSSYFISRPLSLICASDMTAVQQVERSAQNIAGRPRHLHK